MSRIKKQMVVANAFRHKSICKSFLGCM